MDLWWSVLTINLTGSKSSRRHISAYVCVGISRVVQVKREALHQCACHHLRGWNLGQMWKKRKPVEPRYSSQPRSEQAASFWLPCSLLWWATPINHELRWLPPLRYFLLHYVATTMTKVPNVHLWCRFSWKMHLCTHVGPISPERKRCELRLQPKNKNVGVLGGKVDWNLFYQLQMTEGLPSNWVKTLWAT